MPEIPRKLSLLLTCYRCILETTKGKGQTADTIERQAVTANPTERKENNMYKMTKEFYAPTKHGFSCKPYQVEEKVVTDEFFESYTDPSRTKLFDSLGYERRYPNGSIGCKIVTIPPDGSYRRIVRFKRIPRAYVGHSHGERNEIEQEQHKDRSGHARWPGHPRERREEVSRCLFAIAGQAATVGSFRLSSRSQCRARKTKAAALILLSA